MSFGLQTFNSSGIETLNTSYQISRIHTVIGGISVGTNSSTTISVAGMQNDGTWHIFLNNSASNAYISVNSGSFTITVPSYGGALSNANCIVLRSNGSPTSSGYGFFGTNDIGAVQIDQNYSNFVYVGGSTNAVTGSTQTLPSGYNFQNSIILARPSGTNTVSFFSMPSNNTFLFASPANSTYEWMCFAPASTISMGSDYGMRVYDQNGSIVFDTNYKYLRYAGQLDIPFTSFPYTFTSSPPAGEKSYILINNFGLLRIQYIGNNTLHLFYRTAISSNDGVDIRVTTGAIATNLPNPTNITFGSSRQFTFFHSKF